MKTKNKEIVFSNGDPMKPVFCVDGKKYYTDKDVERLIEEYDDRLRVARGNLNLVETLNSFVERDLKKARRALWLARAYRAEAKKNYWYARSCHEGDEHLWSIDGSAVKYIGCIKRTNFDWLKVWSEIEIKCLKKAKEYR